MTDKQEANTPRILDESGREVTPDQVNYEKGYLVPDSIVKEHHPAVEAQDRKSHYYPTVYYFEDETSYKVTAKDDPRVKANEDGVSFEFVPQTEDEKSKVVRGVDVVEVEDQPQIAAKEAYDEYEMIQRYKLYTEEELTKRKEQKEKQNKEEAFLATGSDRLTSTETDIKDINTALAEILGVA